MTDDMKTSSTKKVQPSELHQIVPTVYEGRRGHRGLRECTHRLLASAARATCLAEQNRANRQRCQHVSAGKASRWPSALAKPGASARLLELLALMERAPERAPTPSA